MSVNNASGSSLASLSLMVSNLYSKPTTSQNHVNPEIQQTSPIGEVPQFKVPHVEKNVPMKRKMMIPGRTEVKMSKTTVSTLLHGYQTAPKDPKICEALTTLQQQLFFLEDMRSVAKKTIPPPLPMPSEPTTPSLPPTPSARPMSCPSPTPTSPPNNVALHPFLTPSKEPPAEEQIHAEVTPAELLPASMIPVEVAPAELIIAVVNPAVVNPVESFPAEIIPAKTVLMEEKQCQKENLPDTPPPSNANSPVRNEQTIQEPAEPEDFSDDSNISSSSTEVSSDKDTENNITAKDYLQPPRLTVKGRKVGRPVGSVKKYNLELSEEGQEVEDGEMVLQCGWKSCREKFEKQKDFFEHVRQHLLECNEALHTCYWEACTHSAPFDAYYKIQAHVRHHTKEKPFRCNVLGCKSSYSRMENLKTHKRLHTGEKPFFCKVCGKRFTNGSDTACHLKRVHSDKKHYFCLAPNCKKSYTDPSSLRKHFQNHHQELVKDFYKGKYRLYVPTGKKLKQEEFVKAEV